MLSKPNVSTIYLLRSRYDDAVLLPGSSITVLRIWGQNRNILFLISGPIKGIFNFSRLSIEFFVTKFYLEI